MTPQIHMLLIPIFPNSCNNANIMCPIYLIKYVVREITHLQQTGDYNNIQAIPKVDQTVL